MDLAKADRLVRRLKPKAKPYDQALGSSICCRVTADGGKVLYWRSEVAGRQQRFKLGYYPAITVADAYNKAQEFKAQLRNGFDPRVEERRRAKGGDVPRTVAEAAQRYIDEHVQVKNRASWAKEAERLIRSEVLPSIGTYPLAQLQRSDLAALIATKMSKLRAKGGRGTAANRLSAVVSRFMSFCASHGWVEEGLGYRLPKPAVETPRERILSLTELRNLREALEKVRAGKGPVLPVYGQVLALLMLTGCRCSEITGLTHQSVDRQSSVITIAEGKTKASRRSLPLPRMAWAIVADQMETAKEPAPTDLLFPLPKGGVIPSNEVSRAARRLVAALGHAPWTPHDLRRTAVSILAELGIDGDIRRRITGHQAADIHGRVYDQARRQQDIRNALGQLEAEIVGNL